MYQIFKAGGYLRMNKNLCNINHSFESETSPQTNVSEARLQIMNGIHILAINIHSAIMVNRGHKDTGLPTSANHIPEQFTNDYDFKSK